MADLSPVYSIFSRFDIYLREFQPISHVMHMKSFVTLFNACLDGATHLSVKFLELEHVVGIFFSQVMSAKWNNRSLQVTSFLKILDE